MKLKFVQLAAAVLACSLTLSTRAQSAPPTLSAQPIVPIILDPVKVDAGKIKVGAEQSFDQYINIEVKNLQDESLGRIKDLGIDLINGRIVEVLVISDDSLDVKNKVVAVPPLALIPDAANQVYRLNVSTDTFKAAAGIDLSKWEDFGRSDRVAAAYHHFGQPTYFLEEGAAPKPVDAKRPLVPLGYVERSSRILDMAVGNFEDQKLGKVWALTMDITKGRIRSVVIIAPGNLKTKSVVPATALSFNSKRDALLLDLTKLELADEPRYVFTAAAFGQDAYSHEESYSGPRTSVALEQGSSYRDIDRTILINQGIRTAKLDRSKVEIGTMNGRVTLRGSVKSEDDKRRMGEIAIAASRLELVDNQIVVGQPVATGNN